MAKAVPFGAWAPDVASVDAAVSAVATNVFPKGDGYGPVAGPRPVTAPLPGPSRGGFSVRTLTGAWYAFAATATGLYRFDPATLGWVDVSNPAHVPYSLPPEQYWSFARYGKYLFATMLGAPLQRYDIEAGGTFIDAPKDPASDPIPRARHLAVVNEFLVLAGLDTDPNGLAWCELGNPTWWTPGVRGADVQYFPEGGDVTGFTGGDYGAVFQERAIRRMTFVGGDLGFQFDKIEDGRGAVAPWSVAKIGPRTFFLDREGFFALAEGASVPIGLDRVDAWYRAVRDPTYTKTAVAVADPSGPRILWAFKSKNVADPTMLDQGICYDFARDRWTKLDLPVRYWIRSETAPVSLDSISENVDAGTAPYDFAGGLSLDSAIFSGGVPQVGVFGTDDTLSLLEGPALEATIETAEVMLGRGNRAFMNGARVDTDADAWLLSVWTRESLARSEPRRYRPEVPPNRQRVGYCRASGRYHGARARIPAGTDWTYIKSIEPDVTLDGVL